MKIHNTKTDARINIAVDYETVKKLRVYALESSTPDNRVTIRQIATQAINEYLERNKSVDILEDS
jgi:post-segregation antitoxin (ccd killing protein)